MILIDAGGYPGQAESSTVRCKWKSPKMSGCNLMSLLRTFRHSKV